MKKLALVLAAAPLALALTACGDTTPVDDGEMAADPAAQDAAMAPADPAMPADADMGATPAPGTPPVEDTGDRVTIDADGVTADVGNANTRVRANVDGDPSVTVETD